MSKARPSRSGKDAARQATAISNASSTIWEKVRRWYPEPVRQHVDDIEGTGGLTLRDLSTLTTAEMFREMTEENTKGVNACLRLLFRIAMMSGGATDASTVPVRIPEGLAGISPDGDEGDDLL